jgi:hypothetical protein
MVQLERSLAKVRDQEEKCVGICEDNRDAQEQTDANKAHIEGCLTRDATRADVVGVAIMRQMARYEKRLRPPAVGAQGPVGPGPAQRIICKPEKDLKPQELTADMTPVEFAYWVDAFEAYHADSHMFVFVYVLFLDLLGSHVLFFFMYCFGLPFVSRNPPLHTQTQTG